MLGQVRNSRKCIELNRKFRSLVALSHVFDAFILFNCERTLLLQEETQKRKWLAYLWASCCIPFKQIYEIGAGMVAKSYTWSK